ncbi:uncharacterized protein N0V89_009297 [Didymosphaeria variabile]|uniref:Cytochrome P450 n=1 Tax=Didymosphaeria variabile TaxID=1932322 RepID=A0A9W9C7H8_9PLEO|nr:uncharacterized protein N0V89_009297 [Didymosphaeria variabile]KAJ4347925.1 hypothetical protein N0V89_009297 [Didymosphaeria variabile]
MALPSPFVGALVVGFVTAIYTFSIKLYRARMLLINRRRQGLPTAPNHSFLFGHLLYLKSVLDRHPKDAHYQFGFAAIAREKFASEGAFYMDLWPMSGLFLTVTSPKVATEITQTNPKLTSDRPQLLRRFLKPITGGLTIFDLDEKDWKPWRAVFNKGFHSERMYGLVPNMVEEVQVFAGALRDHAARDQLCFLDPITLRFTIDMIGRSIMNTSLHAQTGFNDLADGMLSQIRWHNPNAEINPFSHFNFVRAFVHWKNRRQMDRYIGAELDRRFQEYKSNAESSASKSVIDLALQEYLKGSEKLPDKLDPSFRAFAIRQIKLFIFAGYDSTGSTFSVTLRRPILQTLREEHDKVLGSNPAAAASRLAVEPRIINNLPYTLAVIKEVLRLFPPAGTTRAGKPGVSVTDDAGNALPTDDAILWILHVEMHNSPNYWVRADEFLPERWLASPDDELYPAPGAWRPFELGPRNCIGQALVLIELRVILACLVREFDIVPAYDEWDRRHPTEGVKLLRGNPSMQKQRPCDIEYQTNNQIATQPTSQPAIREIRASYNTESITVYQAYNSTIASAAVTAQKLSASPLYKPGRTTWIKPSWCWMMYRSGYSYKDANQSCILALKMKHEHFATLLRSALVAGDPRAAKEGGATVVQWDPERGARLEKLGWRSIQIGIRGEVRERWIEEWIGSIEDVTEVARGMKKKVDEDADVGVKELVRTGLVPEERLYAVERGIVERLGMSG